jgi:hypothetical protein
MQQITLVVEYQEVKEVKEPVKKKWRWQRQKYKSKFVKEGKSNTRQHEIPDTSLPMVTKVLMCGEKVIVHTCFASPKGSNPTPPWVQKFDINPKTVTLIQLSSPDKPELYTHRPPTPDPDETDK